MFLNGKKYLPLVGVSKQKSNCHFQFIMAEDEDGVSEKNSPQSLNNEEQAQETEQNALQPDLGIEVAGHGDSENGVASPTESKRPSSSEC